MCSGSCSQENSRACAVSCVSLEPFPKPGPGHALQLQSCAGDPSCWLGPDPCCLQPPQGHSWHICRLCASRRGEGWNGCRGSAQLLVKPRRKESTVRPVCINCQLGSSNINNILLKLFCFSGCSQAAEEDPAVLRSEQVSVPELACRGNKAPSVPQKPFPSTGVTEVTTSKEKTRCQCDRARRW